MIARVLIVFLAALTLSSCAPRADFVDGLYAWVHEIRVAIGRMENRQVPIKQINFIPPSEFEKNKSEDTDVSIYSKTIGNLEFRENIAGVPIIFSFVTGVGVAGVDDADGTSLMLFVDQLDQKECREINKRAGIEGGDVKLSAALDYTKLGGADMDAQVAMGQAEYTTIEKLNVSSGLLLGDDAAVPGSAALKGHRRGCFFDPGINSYRFYAALSAD